MAGWIFLLAASATFALDQASKAIATRHPPAVRTAPGSARWSFGPALNPVRGGSRRRFRPIALWLVTALMAALWIARIGPRLDAIAAATLGGAIGGAAGNACDRVVRGGVIDFIAWRRMVAFNLADLAIIAAVATLAIRWARGF